MYVLGICSDVCLVSGHVGDGILGLGWLGELERLTNPWAFIVCTGLVDGGGQTIGDR